MTTALIVIALVFAFIISGMVILLKTANKYKFPDTYDKSKIGYKDEEEEDYKIDSECQKKDKNKN